MLDRQGKSTMPILANFRHDRANEGKEALNKYKKEKKKKRKK
jgi:hypothetical protein